LSNSIWWHVERCRNIFPSICNHSCRWRGNPFQFPRSCIFLTYSKTTVRWPIQTFYRCQESKLCSWTCCQLPYLQQSIKLQQERQCTCNDIWAAFVQPLSRLERDTWCIFWVRSCSLSYAAWNGRFHIVMWPARLYRLFSTLSFKMNDFRTNVSEHKVCGLILSTTFVIKHFSS
jgi:hypothetical protein